MILSYYAGCCKFILHLPFGTCHRKNRSLGGWTQTPVFYRKEKEKEGLKNDNQLKKPETLKGKGSDTKGAVVVLQKGNDAFHNVCLLAVVFIFVSSCCERLSFRWIYNNTAIVKNKIHIILWLPYIFDMIIVR